ncbi:NfeD family protein [Cerasicoccus frondis]|uniref:NfeD family protein n=1 Tax=Cerasicoccus frondis TaxID=490090 RepID=UPI0028524B00|nr:NfeD family protein [Cerasicoccus frondis]
MDESVIYIAAVVAVIALLIAFPKAILPVLIIGGVLRIMYDFGLLAVISLLPNKDQKPYSSLSRAPQATKPKTPSIGQTGVVIHALRPLGKIEIDGESHLCRADIGYIEKGRKIEIISDSPLTARSID